MTGLAVPHEQAPALPSSLRSRLGLNIPAKWWPTRAGLKAVEAAGFSWVQVHAPDAAVLRSPRDVLRHARALRRELDTCGLRLVMHAPDELRAGDAASDRALAGLFAHADVACAEIVVYHGANHSLADPAAARERLGVEQRALRRLMPAAEKAGVVVCIENLAPVFAGPPRLSHAPSVVRRLAESLGSPAAAVCLDVGHANIAAALAGVEPTALMDAAGPRVELFHVHDNFGARRRGETRPGVEPLRLDVHLPPGEGTIDWASVAPRLARHEAPLLLEVHPPHRPEPTQLSHLFYKQFTTA